MRKFNSILENKNNADVYSVQLNSELIYAMYEGSQVGSLILCYHGQKASVFSLLILDKYRGKGFSKTLMNKAISRCKEKGIKLLELATERLNVKANNLYIGLGFKLESIDENDYNNYSLII